MLGTLKLVRDTFTPNETLGKFYINDEYICECIERPWLDNQQRVSCIPEGVYKLQLRYSPVVKRSSGGKYTEGYEITNVPNRSYIMIHSANFSSQLHGCCSPGEKRGMIDGQVAVLNSRKAFDKVMGFLDLHNDWEIEVTHLK